MANGINQYLNPVDEELNSTPASLEEYMALAQQQQAQQQQAGGPMGPQSKAALQKYLSLADKSSSDEEAGVGQLQQYLNDYRDKPQGTDFTPLAAWADSLTRKPGNTLEVAKLMRPESKEAREEKLIKLQDMLQQRKGAMSGRQLTAMQAGLKQQLASDQYAQQQVLLAEKNRQAQELNSQKMEQEKIRTEAYQEGIKSKERIAQQQLDAAKLNKDVSQRRADERQGRGIADKEAARLESQLQKYEQKAIDAVPLVENLQVVEEILGGSLEQYDPKTGTINGMKIDLPGKSVPGIGRVFAPGSQGERLHVAMANIFNTTLKERSGAAVTDQELQRLKGEFASGKFNTEEKMIDAMQRYKNILRKRMRQHEAAYKPEVRNLYRTQGGMTSEDFFPEPGAGKPPPGPQRKTWQGKTYELQGDTWVEVVE